MVTRSGLSGQVLTEDWEAGLPRESQSRSRGYGMLDEATWGQRFFGTRMGKGRVEGKSTKSSNARAAQHRASRDTPIPVQGHRTLSQNTRRERASGRPGTPDASTRRNTGGRAQLPCEIWANLLRKKSSGRDSTPVERKRSAQSRSGQRLLLSGISPYEGRGGSR